MNDGSLAEQVRAAPESSVCQAGADARHSLVDSRGGDGKQLPGRL